MSTRVDTMDTEARARLTGGTSADAVYRMVAAAMAETGSRGGTLVDMGCGTGALWPHIRDRFARYVGVDVVRYDGFPAEGEFRRVDLDAGRADLADGCADAVAAVETIEHVENPRAFMRELARIARPGGWIFVTTPNQASLLSKLTLLLRNEFNAFQERPGLYPAHITALLPMDLVRIARECGLEEVGLRYSRFGRLPGTAWRYPSPARNAFPRALSDNVLVMGRRPLGEA
jgi:SAM-dependent methyltransferase